MKTVEAFMVLEPSGSADHVAALETRLRLAMLASDCAELDALIAPELVFTTHLGQLLGKADDLSMHGSGMLRFSRLDPSEVRMAVDASLAVVTVRMRTAGSFGAFPFTEDLRFTRVWRRAGDGCWRIVAGHSSRVAPPA